ncbi:hypothetical protein I2494_11720 [Budviciaceae bacterium BWR-B9]|uniref:Uncharacterized protein n=1 Tax=Limnobaculum allomyrinae TaxID=2791986 RepID=A0ABS1IRW8_9GAMM|nr:MULTISPECIES: hypothetical protein [Limnobaculum]MBK5144379.1 hypothetical protein [Limnobaculum allomyrinae]MBV7691876.1 hypothetical protein [Limnobaculum sp. M2-1]
MRELHSYEVEEVSGAGKIADTATAIGGQIGGLVGSFTKNNQAATIGSTIGQGLGNFVEAGITAVSNLVNLFKGLFGKK